MQPALGRLAQLVEHALDVRRVSGSSPLSSTMEASRFLSRCFFYFFPGGKLDGTEAFTGSADVGGHSALAILYFRGKAPADLRNFEPCPVHEFQGKAVFTDGHTRAFAAYRAEALSLQRRLVVSAETVYRSDGGDLYSSGPVFPGIYDRKNDAGVCLKKPVQTRRSGDVRHFFRERQILDAGNSAMKTHE